VARQKLRELGVCEGVVSVMKAFPDEAPVQAAAAALIASLAQHSNPNAAKLGALRAPGLLLAALKKHPQERDVQLQGARALGWLAKNDDNLSSLADDGTVEALILVIKGFPTDMYVRARYLKARALPLPGLTPTR
jgi:hypothetical protein